MKYFAYGSNLDVKQMVQRCPGARLVGPAQLTDHRLCFPRRSPVRDCAVASVESHKGQIIWGVIYEIDENDAKRLDEREGFDPVNTSAINRYCRVDVMVTRNPGDRVEAFAYVAVPEDDPGRPSAEYVQHIVDGAIAHSFPDDYIEMLRAIVVEGDSFPRREDDRSNEDASASDDSQTDDSAEAPDQGSESPAPAAQTGEPDSRPVEQNDQSPQGNG